MHHTGWFPEMLTKKIRYLVFDEFCKCAYAYANVQYLPSKHLKTMSRHVAAITK